MADAVLDAVEACPGWVTNTRISKPPLTIMGSIEEIEAGLRQLRRSVPLETTVVDLPDEMGRLVVPTIVEALRIKAFLIVQRNQVRDYLDVAARTNLASRRPQKYCWRWTTTTRIAPERSTP